MSAALNPPVPPVMIPLPSVIALWIDGAETTLSSRTMAKYSPTWAEV